MTMTPQEPHVETGIIISFAQMYEAIQNVSSEVTRQGGTLKQIDTKLDQVIASTEDHEHRIRTLEKKVWGVGGVAGGLGGIIGYIVNFFATH